MKLFFRRHGQGKPLFILHGLFGCSDNWATVGKILSGKFEVYLLDLRNHGNSPHSDEWNYPAMANDIKETMDGCMDEWMNGWMQPRPNDSSVGRASTILIGHSMGGKVAMQFAAMHPEKVEKLIVIDVATKEYPVHEIDFIRKLSSLKLNEAKSRKEIERQLSKITDDLALIQLMQKNIRWTASPLNPLSHRRGEKGKGVVRGEVLDWKFNLPVIAKEQNRIEKTFSLGKKAINIPALFIRGGKSDYIQDADIPKIKRLFPRAEFLTIKGAGHWVHADKPKEFTEHIMHNMKYFPA